MASIAYLALIYLAELYTCVWQINSFDKNSIPEEDFANVYCRRSVHQPYLKCVIFFKYLFVKYCLRKVGVHFAVEKPGPQLDGEHAS